MTRLPVQLRMVEAERVAATPCIAAKLAEGISVPEVVAELSRDLPDHFKYRPGFIADRLAKLTPKPPSRADVHAATVSDRGIYAAGQNPERAADATAAEIARQAREALKLPRASVRDKRSRG